ncbi:hypothetical protein ROZALSC1DRAFT_24291 [Rozella allomycis CSF55]|uniref:Uncharacterized protein n=1 Tax=Rozella allomycis (strain CSF55) TaxID=988480 RepID=A0A4P9YDW8_ROZAC|nr:hypothetical protein ROZALSC1DRAFT_24291 [Rozella allomycis CSF55]
MLKLVDEYVVESSFISSIIAPSIPQETGVHFVKNMSDKHRNDIPYTQAIHHPKNIETNPQNALNESWTSEAPLCCLTCLCPCYTHGAIEKLLDDSKPSPSINGILGCLAFCCQSTTLGDSISTRREKSQKFTGKKLKSLWQYLCCYPVAMTEEYIAVRNVKTLADKSSKC